MLGFCNYHFTLGREKVNISLKGVLLSGLLIYVTESQLSVPFIKLFSLVSERTVRVDVIVVLYDGNSVEVVVLLLLLSLSNCHTQQRRRDHELKTVEKFINIFYIYFTVYLKNQLYVFNACSFEELTTAETARKLEQVKLKLQK